MKKYILIFLLFPILIFGQSTKQRIRNNLEKYWDYRARLEQYFVVLDPNSANSPGTNLVAADINNQDSISYSDGNGAQPYYLGMLATECAILKMNGLNYSNTLNKLKWALDAVDRLDSTAEKHFRTPERSLGTEDLNGFMLRNDVDEAVLWEHDDFPEELNCFHSRSTFRYHKPPEYLEDCESGEEVSKNFINSKDNVWHYLLNLSLVVKLVDDPSIKLQAQKLAWRLVNNFRDLTPGGQTCWVIENPVTGCVVQGGGEIENRILKEFDLRSIRWGFAIAGNKITEGSNLPDLWQGGTFCDRDCFETRFYDGEQWKPIWSGGEVSLDARYILATIIGNYNWQRNYINLNTWTIPALNCECHEYELYNDLRWIKADNGFFEHFSLVYQILHGNSEPFNMADSTDIDWYLDLFDELQPVDSFLDHNSRWFSDNRLVWPPMPDKDKDTRCNASHIDYLLLYNLFWLTYVQNYHDIIDNTGLSCNEINLAKNHIFEHSIIQPNCSVTDIAGSCITLEPGFKAISGSYFKGKIDGVVIYNTNKSNRQTQIFCMPENCENLKMNDSRNEEKTNDKIDFKEEDIDYGIEIFPNPTSRSAFLNFYNLLGHKTIEIFSLTGLKILELDTENDYITLDISAYKEGVYIVYVIHEYGTTAIRLLIE